MRTTFSAIAALAAVAGAQSTTSIDVDAISVAIPTSVFVLPVVYVTAENAPTLTATTLATTATPSSDPKATAVFDSAADVTAAIVSASEAAAASATAAVEKRDGSCVQQPLGISHASLPDTAAAFASDAWYGVQAVAAGTPTGFVQTFSNLTASNSADGYMGFTLLSSYDVPTCGAKCSAISGCNSFNIYFERDPQYDPSVAACNNPASTVNVKCVFWGGAVTSSNANNFGQMRDGFNVVIAGSNGYIANTYAAKLAVQATATSSSSAAPTATDAAGNLYTIYYSSDSTQGAYSNAQAASSFSDCMTACDNAASSGCTAFTYVGGNNGQGSGTCWLKSALGNASPAGNNVVSGVRSGKVSSSSSIVASTTSSSSSSSFSSVSISSVSKTSSSVSSSSTSSVASTTTSSSSSVTPTTMSTSTKSASSTSTSSTSTSSAAAQPTTFSITSGDFSSWLSVAPGANGVTSWTFNSATAFDFTLDPTTGYLLEGQGASIGYAATVSKGVNGQQQVLFNAAGNTAKTYVTCAQVAGTSSAIAHLDCKVNNVLQQAFVCSDNWNLLYFINKATAQPSNCNTISLYYQ
ncbi:hypothetical protein D6D01_06591 [Aureobasidium pullulans]|uniref:Apple domain-containing protein n=1 Tax=Aureobasidium pullulans TaxID=5580 RepID=A0A4V6TEQ7_AURPU|nr:hypothetical protein D6D01_06591 [Aureobasidium pullulans]